MEMAFHLSEVPDFKIFWGSMPPYPPRLRGLMPPYSYSRLFFSNQLSTSNFIETPAWMLKGYQQGAQKKKMFKNIIDKNYYDVLARKSFFSTSTVKHFLLVLQI